MQPCYACWTNTWLGSLPVNIKLVPRRPQQINALNLRFDIA
jgi:hypothetical protein